MILVNIMHFMVTLDAELWVGELARTSSGTYTPNQHYIALNVDWPVNYGV